MKKYRGFQSVQWASLSIAAGGLLMAVFWIAYTISHGPTSFYEERAVLGRSMLFWGIMFGGPPNLLIALGLIILYPRLTSDINRLAQVGYFLTVISLIVSGGLDLFFWRAAGPPFFVPLLGAGLIFLAQGSKHNLHLEMRSRSYLMWLGVLLVIAFGWALIPLEVTDQVGGFRLYGLVASFATGIVWVMLGISFWRMPVSIHRV